MNIKYEILVDHIREEMEKQDIQTMKELASRLGIQAGTLSNNIKYISTIDKFDTPFFTKLVDILELDKDKFIEKISGDLNDGKSLERKIITSKFEEAKREHGDYYQTLIELISNLESGDTYTLVTSDAPLEFIGYDKFVDGIVGSLMKGAKFQYVFPDKRSNDFENKFNKYWPKPFKDWKQLEDLYEDFVKTIIEEIDTSLHPDLTEKKLRNDRLRYIKCDDPYLLHPFLKFMWLHKDQKKGDKRFDMVFAEYRVGNPNSIDVSSQFRLWYPLPEIEGKKIINQINTYDDEYK